jgi:hypothetical protein
MENNGRYFKTNEGWRIQILIVFLNLPKGKSSSPMNHSIIYYFCRLTSSTATTFIISSGQQEVRSK